MKTVLRLLKGLPLLVFSPLLILLPAVCLGLCDVVFLLVGRRRPRKDTRPNTASASVVIPNWKGPDGEVPAIGGEGDGWESGE
jgi:hypothetical protein